MDKIILAERMHPCIQGEGLNTGEKMVVVRVFGCPLKCDSCDSKQTWDTQLIEYDAKSFYKEIKKNLKRFHTNHVLLTGGEPGIYLPFLNLFFQEYQEKLECEWDIETAGVHDWADLYEWEDKIQFNFSPKIGALVTESNLELKAFDNPPCDYIVKVVTSKETFQNDIEKIKELQTKYEIDDSRVYLMPKGTTKSEITKQSKWLIKQIFKTPYNFSYRVHILIYNNKKLV